MDSCRLMARLISEGTEGKPRKRGMVEQGWLGRENIARDIAVGTCRITMIASCVLE
jgi:hypothetical protein